jgi:hypothetical protein
MSTTTPTPQELEINKLIRAEAGKWSAMEGYSKKVDVQILLVVAESRGMDGEVVSEYIDRLVAEKTLVEVEPNLLFVPAPF